MYFYSTPILTLTLVMCQFKCLFDIGNHFILHSSSVLVKNWWTTWTCKKWCLHVLHIYIFVLCNYLVLHDHYIACKCVCFTLILQSFYASSNGLKWLYLHLYDMCILNHIQAQYWYRPQKSNIAWTYYMWYALFTYCNVPKYTNNIYVHLECDHESLMSTLILYFKIITSLIFSWSEI